MTRDHFRKKTARAYAAADDRTYLDAASLLRRSHDGENGGVVLADRLRAGLVVALQEAGWPVVVEHCPQFHALAVYAGPATIHVGRAADPPWSASGDEHPDDPAVFDRAAPLTVTVWAPLAVGYCEDLGRVIGVDAHEIPGVWSPTQIVAEVDRVLGQARRRDLADLPLSAPCGICGDRYTAGGLFHPASPEVAACPCCVFDGDLLGPDPAQLAFDLDRAADQGLAAPAGWAAVQALLCCLGGPDLPDWLDEDWREAGTVYLPEEHWRDPALTWLWLPPAERRPAALTGLGCGSSLGHVLAAVDRAHPDARDRFHAHLQGSREYLDGEDAAFGHDEPVPEEIVERFWPAAVAYTVAMLTQHAERPQHRAPWHVLESLELGDWLDILAPDCDSYQVETVLREGFLIVRDLLDPGEPMEPHPCR